MLEEHKYKGSIDTFIENFVHRTKRARVENQAYRYGMHSLLHDLWNYLDERWVSYPNIPVPKVTEPSGYVLRLLVDLGATSTCLAFDTPLGDDRSTYDRIGIENLSRCLEDAYSWDYDGLLICTPTLAFYIREPCAPNIPKEHLLFRDR